MSTPRSWTEQWERVSRWLIRIRETKAGLVHTRESETYQDDLYAFFQNFHNCYHLKDWVKNDPVSAAEVADVETFISNTESLRICADLTNGTKHFVVTTPRQDPETRVGSRNIHISLGGPEAMIAITFNIVAGGTTRDAHDVAEECFAAWEKYLASKRLI
jgi:hypothetical protein